MPEPRAEFDRISLRRLVLIRWVAVAGQAVTFNVDAFPDRQYRGDPSQNETVANDLQGHFVPLSYKSPRFQKCRSSACLL